MNRMPCSITDGPQYDDNEMFPPKPEPNPDYERDMLLDKKFALNIGLGPLITPFTLRSPSLLQQYCRRLLCCSYYKRH